MTDPQAVAAPRTYDLATSEGRFLHGTLHGRNGSRCRMLVGGVCRNQQIIERIEAQAKQWAIETFWSEQPEAAASPAAPAVDVERLAEVFHNVDAPHLPWSRCTERVEHQRAAEEIAAEYARLTRQSSESTAEREGAE